MYTMYSMVTISLLIVRNLDGALIRQWYRYCLSDLCALYNCSFIILFLVTIESKEVFSKSKMRQGSGVFGRGNDRGEGYLPKLLGGYVLTSPMCTVPDDIVLWKGWHVISEQQVKLYSLIIKENKTTRFIRMVS